MSDEIIEIGEDGTFDIPSMVRNIKESIIIQSTENVSCLENPGIEISRMVANLDLHSYKFFQLGKSSTILLICKIEVGNNVLSCNVSSNTIIVSTTEGVELSIPSTIQMKPESAKASVFEDLIYIKLEKK